MLDEYLPQREQREPQGKVYGETDDGEYETLRSKMPDHADDDDLEEMPRNAQEGGMGGRASEDRRGGRDRRRGAMDSRIAAADSFEAMFGTSRIKLG
jgi:hypothetical protein